MCDSCRLMRDFLFYHFTGFQTVGEGVVLIPILSSECNPSLAGFRTLIGLAEHLDARHLESRFDARLVRICRSFLFCLSSESNKAPFVFGRSWMQRGATRRLRCEK